MADGTAPSFGAGLVARSRPRLSAPTRLRRSSAVGAVGRSTLGFGRIIATAGSARPTVTPDVLATRSLRPPVAAWSLFGDAAEPEPELTPWTTRAVTTAPTVRRAPQAAPAPKPTARPQQSKAAGQVDALRRMLEARGMIEPSAEPPSDTAPAPAPPAADHRDATATGDRSATTAGSDTAPGRFGHRVRPEPTAPESPLSSVFPDGAPSPAIRRAPQSTGGNDLDRFRRALETRGMIESPADTTSARPTGTSSAPTSDASRVRRPRASERSTPSRPNADRGVDADGDSERVPVAPSRSLPFALAPDASPAPRRRSPQRLQRSIAPGTAPSVPDAADDAPVAPGGVVTSGRRPEYPARPDPTSPAPNSRADAATGSVTSPAALAPAATNSSPAVSPDAAANVAAAPPTAASPTQAPPSTVASEASNDTTSGPAPIRRTELRQLSHRIGLDRTLATDVSAPAAVETDQVVTPPASSTVVAPPPGGARPAEPTTIHRAADPAVPPSAPATTVSTPTSSVASPRGVPAVAVPVATDTTREAVAATRAPIVVTRASEARVATRNVRRRMAGRRFTDPAVATIDATGAVAPAVMALGNTAPAPTNDSLPAAHVVRRSTDVEGASRIPPGIDPAVRSAVAPGPGALGRALRTAATEPASLPTVATPTTSTPAVAPRPTVAPGDRLDRSPGRPERALASSATDAPHTSGRPESPARPDVPDPAALADATAPRLVSSAPGVITRSATPAAADHGELGERFLRELGRAPDTAARELPTPFRPLATAVAGSARQARVSSDRVSRQALEAVGKEAVTVGDTIHLVRPPRDDIRTREVLAHELVHVAHPSPVPRFFDDDHRGPEERMAEQVAQVIARSPVMPSAPVPSQTQPPAPASTAARAGSIRRSPAPGAGSGGVSASALAAAIEGRSSGSAVSRGTAGTAGSSDDQPIRRSSASASMAGEQVAHDDADLGVGGPAQLFGSNTRDERDRFDQLLERSIDRVVRRVEQRVIAELERRGGRYWRDF